ncbi:N-acetyltransferase ECO1 [Favolaschia claudopus]|uniref:N-acetyltransferase ECO1 n=1 Tax=Favolaschia claudopus TaxID=2862362 RepID=A0AAW0BCU4_9AGAR
MSSTLKRTYSRQNRTSKPSVPSSPPSTLSSSPVAGQKRKRPLEERLENILTPAHKQPRTFLNKFTRKPKAKASSTPKLKPKAKELTQLHFITNKTTLRTCTQCGLSYTKGAPDDEALHKSHCARVQKGMEWGREEEKETVKAGVVEVASGVKLKNGTIGRIICFRADVGGRIGSKLSTLLSTMNTALSAPALSPAILQASKAYLFLAPSLTTTLREKIVGCVMAQQISTAMAIATPDDCISACDAQSSCSPSSDAPTSSPTSRLVPVDTTTGIFCHPAPLPTPLGSLDYSFPSTLLSAAAQTFIYGCPLDPRKGEVAFTQPTGDGSAVMQRWGGGGVRIYEE